MKRETAIAGLKANEDEIRALGATSIYRYGSTGRDEAGSDSDLDVFVEYAPGFTLFELAGIKALLEENLGVQVDVTTRKGLNPLLKKRIEESAIRVL